MSTKYVIAIFISFMVGIFVGIPITYTDRYTSKILKKGIPKRRMWYKDAEVYHHIFVMQDGYIIYGTNMILGGPIDGEYIEVECKPLQKNACGDAKLLKLKFLDN